MERRAAVKFLVVDVGNTSTAAGLWTDGAVTRVSHMDGGILGDPDGMRKAVEKALAGLRAPVPAAVASVVPAADGPWKKLLESAAGVSAALFIDARTPSPVRVDYPKKSSVGADRLADATGAFDRYGGPVLVADFGTALTVDAVTADARWIGGCIAPGLPLMRDYLAERTAKLPRMKFGGPCPKIGRSTEQAMRFGAEVGYRGMVREIARTLSRNLGVRFRMVATGGYAAWSLRGLDMPVTVDPTLTLHGVGVIAKEAYGWKR